jgi:hypothetical protein
MLTHRRLWFSAVGVALVAALACASLLLAFAPSGATGEPPPRAQKVPAISLQEILLPSANSDSLPVSTSTTTTSATTTTTVVSGIPADQRVHQTTSDPGTGTTVFPAPASESPTATQQQIISAEAGTPGGVGYKNAAGTPVHPTVLFGLVTDSEYGHMNSDGSVTPFYTNYPVWIVEYQGAVLTPVGGGSPGPGGPSTTSTVPPVHIGTSMTFFDAQTGSYLFGVSF